MHVLIEDKAGLPMAKNGFTCYDCFSIRYCKYIRFLKILINENGEELFFFFPRQVNEYYVH